jgi:integrase
VRQGLGASVNREIEVARPIWRRHRRTHEIGEMPEWGEMFYAVAKQDPRELDSRPGGPPVRCSQPGPSGLRALCAPSGWRLKEVRLLRWSDLRSPNGQARVTVKGGDRLNRVLSRMTCS